LRECEWMWAQHSGSGVEATAIDGLFFALFPDRDATAKLARTAQQLCIRHRLGERTFSPERFHVSLFAFAERASLPRGLVAAAMEAAAAIALRPFEVVFDRAVSFVGPVRPLVLCSQDDIAELIGLQRSLGNEMRRRGLGDPESQDAPHVKLLDDERFIEDHAIEPVRWAVRDFVLVHRLPGHARYIPLGRWPLQG
jgi:RNA 2',3'-cyclic 3'-phosphodiesterase